jgi:hypothetical protein
MVDWAAARLAGIECVADSGCGVTVVRWEGRGSQGGPHHRQEMAEWGWSEAGGELEGRRQFGACRRGDTDAEWRSQAVEWRRWVTAIPAVWFIGWRREESGRAVKGNSDQWWWSLNPSVSRSRRETTGGERTGWRRRLTFT